MINKGEKKNKIWELIKNWKNMIKKLILINFLKKIINMKIIIIKELTYKKIRLIAKARLLSSNLFFKGINLW